MKRRHNVNRLATRIIRALRGESGSGILLILVALAAMLAANSPLSHAYHTLFHGVLPWTPVAGLDSLHKWINDALMPVFFFVVGLEIKRELLDGGLSDPARRRLPVLAALAGMVAPAAIFLTIARTDASLYPGWAIPAATDIAFALGVLGLLGRRAPESLRLFLLTVAIVDDLGAVAIIAVFYTASIEAAWLAAAAVVLAALVTMNRAGVTKAWAFVVLALLLWYCVLHSGVHATVAGMLAAFTIPFRLGPRHGSMLLRMEHALVPLNGYLIVPLFGLANAGVTFSGKGSIGLLEPLPIAIAAGLVLGKQAGIFGAILAAERTGFARRPDGASTVQLWGMATLCGIGFTMSLFIGALAFPADPTLVDQAKLGVLAGSLVSAIAGYAILRLASQPAQPDRACA